MKRILVALSSLLPLLLPTVASARPWHHHGHWGYHRPYYESYYYRPYYHHYWDDEYYRPYYYRPHTPGVRIYVPRPHFWFAPPHPHILIEP
jgi:hypothetical protein